VDLGKPAPKGGVHRAPRQQKSHWPLRIGVSLAALLVVAGVAVVVDRGDGSGIGLPIPGLGGRDDAIAADDPLGWGPTAGELAQASALVADWSPERLAGQVLVGRFHGTDPEIAAEMVRELHLAGVSIQSENVTDADQVRATTAAVHEAVAADRDFPAVIGVDQEGGTVAHLDGVATDFPAYAAAGEAFAADRTTGRQAVLGAAEAAALELRSLGFTWVYAPVADIDRGESEIIGSRSPSDDPRLASAAIRASVDGYNKAGVVSTVKHFVGHGAVPEDSHDEVPVLDLSVDELDKRDLRPFRAAVGEGAPAIMMSHVAISELDPETPASMSSEAYELLEKETGFAGLVITDSLGMGAVVGRKAPAVQALNAGADLLLMPADTALAHETLARAIRVGDVPRERAEEAAAKVIAVQLWQARVAAGVPVPEDATEQAEIASARLEEAG
jgi:beta-N-acetylhexosaminidase